MATIGAIKPIKLPEPKTAAPGSFSNPETGGINSFGTPAGRPDTQSVTTPPQNPLVSIPKASAPVNTSSTASKGPEAVKEWEQEPTSGSGAGTPQGPPVNTTPNPSSPPTSGSTGGTPAPSPTTSTSPSPPPAAPDPGMPNTTVGLVPSAQGTAERAEAEGGWGQAQAENQRTLQELAFNYGIGGVNPNSDLALAALRALQNTQTATNNRGGAKTIESSLFGEDKGRIAETHNREDLASKVKYESAIARANDALAKARQIRDNLFRDAGIKDLEAAERRIPEPGKVSKVQTAKASKAPKVVSSKTQKTTSQVKSSPSKGGAKKVPSIKSKVK